MAEMKEQSKPNEKVLAAKLKEAGLEVNPDHEHYSGTNSITEITEHIEEYWGIPFYKAVEDYIRETQRNYPGFLRSIQPTIKDLLEQMSEKALQLEELCGDLSKLSLDYDEIETNSQMITADIQSKLDELEENHE